MILSRELIAKLEMLLTKFPAISLVSWGRSPLRNKAIGGAPTSGHVSWEAVDLILDVWTEYVPIVKEAMALGFSGIEIDHRNKHLHLDVKQRQKNWWVQLTLDNVEHPLVVSEWT